MFTDVKVPPVCLKLFNSGHTESLIVQWLLYFVPSTHSGRYTYIYIFICTILWKSIFTWTQ